MLKKKDIEKMRNFFQNASVLGCPDGLIYCRGNLYVDNPADAAKASTLLHIVLTSDSFDLPKDYDEICRSAHEALSSRKTKKKKVVCIECMKPIEGVQVAAVVNRKQIERCEKCFLKWALKHKKQETRKK